MIYYILYYILLVQAYSILMPDTYLIDSLPQHKRELALRRKAYSSLLIKNSVKTQNIFCRSYINFMQKGKIFKKYNFSCYGYQVKEAYVLSIEVKPTRDLVSTLICRNEKLVYNLRYSGDFAQGKFLHEYLRRLRKYFMRNVYETPTVTESKAMKVGFTI